MIPEGSRIIGAAREYLATPWHHQGRLKGAGVDCVGLLVCSARDAGLKVRDVEAYPAVSTGPWLIEELEKQCRRVPKAGPFEVGDVLAFLFDNQPWHVALLSQVEPPMIIHSYISTKSVIEVPLHDSWKRRIHSVWRFGG